MNYPVIDMKRTGLNLKAILSFKQVSVNDVQKFLNLSCKQTVYRWFAGERIPSTDHLYALSRWLNVSMNDLLVEEGEILPFIIMLKGKHKIARRLMEYFVIFTVGFFL